MATDKHGSSRSDFLKQVAGATIAVAGAGVGAGIAASPAAARTFIPNTYSLEVDGVNWGHLYDADGGDAEFRYVKNTNSPGSPDITPFKSLGLPTLSPFTVGVGAGMAPEMYEWIKQSFDKSPPAIDGAIVANDPYGVEVGRRWFTNAVMTQFNTPRIPNSPFTFPAMTLTFQADSVTDEIGATGRLVSGRKSKAWLTSNFTFDCDDVVCPSRFQRSSYSYSWSITPSPAGSGDRLLNPGDLSLLVAPAGVPSFQQWYDNFALGGDSSDERQGTLSVWGSTHTVPLYRWTFQGLGIHRLAPRGGILSPGPDVGMVAEMYVERATCQCNHL
ncbi:MAG: hypothetical protein QOG85_1324 [Gaiellaceae bacterium]|jgi:hypothetical protein|nr:hypothetical protein [Gaiellaceae bacterium]